MLTALDFYGSVPTDMRQTIWKIQKWLDRLPDQEIGKHGDGLWTCHGLTRAVHSHFSLGEQWSVRDGFFARQGNEHSWLMRRRTKTEPTLVLDIYPIASIGGPIMLDVSSCGSAWYGLYMVADDHYPKERIAAFDAEAKKILDKAKEM